MRRLQPGKGQITPQCLACVDRDPADFQQPVHLGLRKIIRRLVGRQPIFIQPPGLGARVINHHVMPQHRQPVGRRQARRPRPHDRHLFPRDCRPRERMHAFCQQGIRRKALQTANLHRFSFGSLAHASLFAQGFGRADPRAHAAQDVLRKDRLCRRIGCACRDLADEQRNVDGCRAGRHAGRVKAEITTVGGHLRLMPVKRRIVVCKVVGIGRDGQAVGRDAGGKHGIRHGRGSPLLVFFCQKLARVGNFIKR